MITLSKRTRAILSSHVAAAALLVGILPSAAVAQEVQIAQATAFGSVSGVITGSDGNFRIAANIDIPALNLSTETDREGRYTLRRVPVGTHEVVITYLGAETKRETITVNADQTVTLNATLATVETRAGETVVVTGLRPTAESVAAALQVQRNADSVISVVSADSVGRFPDQNIAFAVGRLPGVSIQRDQGQARYVNLRGSPIRWVTLGFDGLNVVSPEGRASRFDNIPSAIASQIIVTKAITPDLPGDTVAGNINIRTRSAFDYPGFKVSASAGLGITDLGGGEEYDSTFVISNRFFDDKVGILFQASKYRRRMATDNIEADPYVLSGGTRDRRPGFETRRWAREFENKLYRLTRDNQSASGRIDFRPNANHEFFASSIYTEYRDTELRVNYLIRFDQASNTVTNTGACPAVPAAPTTSGFADICRNDPFLGTVYAANLTSNFNSLDSKEFISTNTVGGEHDFGAWDLSWRLNYTYAEDGFDAPGLSNFASPTSPTERPTVFYDFSDNDNNRVELYRTLRDPVTGVYSRGPRVFSIEEFAQNLTGNGIQSREGRDTTEAWTAKFDAIRETELFGNPLTFKVGGLYTDRSKTTESEVFRTTAARLTALGLPPITFRDFRKDQSYIGDLPLGYQFNYHSKSALDGLAARLKETGVAQAADTSGDFFDVSEEILAAYAMGTLEQSWGNIVFGLRAERTKNTGTAVSDLGLITVSSEDTEFYPSAHINWNVTDDIKARVGITTGAARPDFDDLAPNLSFDDATQTIEGGNPEAGPEKSVGIDAYVEWYIQPQGFFSAGIFYKDISDFLFVATDTFGLDVLDSGGVDRSGYDFTTIRNGGSGYIQGFEIAYQQTAETLVEMYKLPDWLGGFGVQANATWVNSEVDTGNLGRKTELPGTSDATYNASLYYEKYGFTGRISYQYRTAWRNSIGTYTLVNGVYIPTGNGDVFWADDRELDLALRYSINNNLEWYFNASNLLNESARRYADGPAYATERETFGRRYMMGLRFNY